jgi:membrane protein DedA with SNARE-associated domain
MGGLATLALTYVPSLTPLFDPRAPTLWVIIGVGALVGAVVSFFLGRRQSVALEQGERAEREIRRAA